MVVTHGAKNDIMFGKTMKHLYFTKTGKNLHFSLYLPHQSNLIFKLPHYAINTPLYLQM